MRILVFGAGAVGSVLGAILSRAHDVLLVGRRAHVARIAAEGLAIEGPQPFQVRVGATERAEEDARPDVVLLTVKAFDTGTALRDLAPAMRRNPILVVAQNGLGNWEAARAQYPTHRVLGASVTLGATLVAPGRVRWGGTGSFVVGGAPADAATISFLVSEFARSGLAAQATPNLAGTLWLKAIVNAAINPLTALHRCPNARLLEDPALRARLRRVTEEAVAVARAEGIELPAADPVPHVERVAEMTGQNRSSMLQSVEKGQRTEIDAITGRILEAAHRRGIACPENEALYVAIKAVEPRRVPA